MKKYLIYLLIFLLTIIQGAFGGPNLVLLLVLFYAGVHSPKKVFWLAFLSGILIDLATGGPIGLSSFLLLITYYLLLIFSRRFNLQNPVLFAFFVLLASRGSLVLAILALGFKEASRRWRL